jgi:hypothetical protein
MKKKGFVTNKVVELLAAAIIAIVITMVIVNLISTAGDAATQGCGPLNQWIADSFNIDTC